MPLLSQAFCGALFCLPFGFSFAALRISTWVLGGSGGIAWRAGQRAGFALAGLSFAFSAAATRDYLAWNRGVWRVGEALIAAEQVTPDQIDGGFEWNNLRALDRPPSWQHLGQGPANVDRSSAPYAITFAPEPEDELREQTRLQPWLPHAPERVYEVRRGAAQ
ncbi:MAG TPA: hypothetical protein VMR86_13290 [Myxococcota bacterium]|nr:hypothetical protein [Myxococcota bacterium]